MRLLFDENLSPKLVRLLIDDFPKSTHLELLGMRGATDAEVWAYAHENGFVIVSKDNDFRQQAFLTVYQPKVVWLSVGNSGTPAIANLLQANAAKIEKFADDPNESLLVIELTGPGE